MAKPYLSKSEWEHRIKQWLASGKSGRAWCEENQIKYSTLMAWRQRLKVQESSHNTSFIELKHSQKTVAPLTLECSGVKIYVSMDFDEELLGKCLKVLRDISC